MTLILGNHGKQAVALKVERGSSVGGAATPGDGGRALRALSYFTFIF